ncbi:MAG: extracellular matrix regulatory protein [Clostridia bacterium]|nr:extracellular matrix regulatory protein [Clostridia bacterium]
MFLHVGNNVAIAQQEIIAILDLTTAGMAPVTREFLRFSKTGTKIEGDPSEARSAIITDKGICFSSISSHTLAKRMREIINSD